MLISIHPYNNSLYIYIVLPVKYSRYQGTYDSSGGAVRSDGFTLLELLISLAIFAVISIVTFAAINHSFRIVESSKGQVERFAEMQIAWHLISQDLLQIVARPVRIDSEQLSAYTEKDDEYLVSKARFLATQAREAEIHYEHKEVGYNYRMSNLLAAVGRGQLQILDERVSTRRAIYGRYFDALSKVDGIQFMSEASYGKTNRWLTTLTVNAQKVGIGRTKIINALEKENIESRPVWKPMHMQPLYQTADYISNGDNDNSRHLFEKGLCLPSGSSLNEKDQGRIIDIILDCINE